MKTWIFTCLIISLAALLLPQFLQKRSIKMAGKYGAFRRAKAAEHAAIDALFPQFDLLVKGQQWHYVDMGPKDGPALLFLHGFPECWYSWRYILPLIDPAYRLIAVDMKGYGRSDKNPNGNYSWPAVAEETKDFMVHGLNISKFVVVSHDWGTLIGSVLAHNHQEHMLGYVRMEVDLILDPNYRSSGLFRTFKTRPQFLFFQLETTAKFIMEDTKPFIEKVYIPRMTTTFHDVDRDYLVYEFSREHSHVVHKYFAVSNWDFETAIEKICHNNFSFPVMQLQADRDPVQPAQLFDSVPVECPNVDLQWIFNASHFMNFDQPQDIANRINLFMRKLSE